MDAKETFLNKILAEIEVLKSAYEHNKRLPASFFEYTKSDSVPSLPISNVPSPQPEIISNNNNDGSEEYGFYKKLAFQIIKEAGKALLKADIHDRATKILNKEVSVQTITNALTGLQADTIIIGYKDPQVKVRGNYWGLSEWFVNGKIKTEHRPDAPNKRNKYL